MGRYNTLAGGVDYLEGEGVSGFVAARARLAEADADLKIDTAFADWDRDAWLGGGGVPPEIALLAKKWGAAEYLRIAFCKASPDVATLPGFVVQLRDEFDALVAQIKARGYLYAFDGSKLYPAESTRRIMFPRIER